MAPHVRSRHGFTLIELLIVVAIIGILAAVAIPNLLLALQRSKQKRTMADIRTIATAWEARATDTQGYNAAGWTKLSTVDLGELGSALNPTYVRAFPRNDGWGQPFEVFADADFGGSIPASRYQIVSNGRNGVAEMSTAPGPTTAFDCDIVFQNGQFLIWPEGTQTDKPQAPAPPSP